MSGSAGLRPEKKQRREAFVFIKQFRSLQAECVGRVVGPDVAIGERLSKIGFYREVFCLYHKKDILLIYAKDKS